MQCLSLNRRFGFACRLLLIFLFSIACLPQESHAATKVVTDLDKGTDLLVKVGDVIELRLQANPASGAQWYVHPKSTALLKLNSETETPGTEPSADRPVVQVFTFDVKRKGDGILLMRYAPQKQKPTLGEEQYTLHVVIDQ
jgi:predicted secreted protein